MTTYTVITFAPVQGFIEKSRKLRDLYGASQILSYLSYCIVKAADSAGLEVISPAIRKGELSIDLIQGMPNRILIVGDIERDKACTLFRNTLYGAWSNIIKACKDWVEQEIKHHVDAETNQEYSWKKYDWNMSWKRWEMHAWEIFLGQGDCIESAMKDLETRKLRRGWTVPNWNGESSSLSGHDAIAYPNMDRQITNANKRNEGREKQEIENFYAKLANALENSKEEDEPKFLDPSEKLSIPELIKRLVTHYQVTRDIPLFPRTKRFSELLRKEDDNEKATRGYWTGWFMGDGDKVGDHLKSLKDDQSVANFSQSLRSWGRQFQSGFKNLGRVIYAGGDDFLGVMYGIRNGTEEQKQRKGLEAIDWLIGLRKDWQSGNLGISLSVGFVWAGHSVPQRDVLQHCREAEKLAKNLGRDRVTIRVVFNNGQFVQWTTPWEYLEWLKDYRDRDGGASWSHVYGDLAQLKARHAISPKSMKEADSHIALELFKLYFGEENHGELSRKRSDITNTEEPKALIQWIEGMIQVGWQLCSNG
ncbi:MAG: type III-B CRISPR-associated protein Cas10/Cmr2 [Pseudanabaena sp. ELA607]